MGPDVEKYGEYPAPQGREASAVGALVICVRHRDGWCATNRKTSLGYADSVPTKEVAVSETNDVDDFVMQTPLIQVVCCAMPNGEALWFEAEKGSEYLNKVVASWKEQHQEFTNTECTMGCIELRMPIDKYYSIQAANSFNWPA